MAGPTEQMIVRRMVAAIGAGTSLAEAVGDAVGALTFADVASLLAERSLQSAPVGRYLLVERTDGGLCRTDPHAAYDTVAAAKREAIRRNHTRKDVFRWWVVADHQGVPLVPQP